MNTPAKYRKKPVITAAMRWDGTAQEATAIIDWALSNDVSIHFRCRDQSGECHTGEVGTHDLAIPTLEGTMLANPGDWIVRGTEGEFYPCKPAAFEATFEAVAE